MSAPRLTVVGGGIAGLAGARAALVGAAELGVEVDVVVVEATERLGGKVWTERADDGSAAELGPDGFLVAKPETERLARELGLGPELVPTGPGAGRAFLWLRGRLRPLPRGLAVGVPRGVRPLWDAMSAGIVSPWGAARAAVEPLVPGDGGRDRPVADVVGRRFGREVAERLVAPLVEGVFGAPTSVVSFEAAFPAFAGRRSLLLGADRRGQAGGPAFRTLRGGLSALVDALADEVRGRGGTIATGRTAGAADLDGEATLLALPAPDAAGLVRPLAPEAAQALGGIAFTGSAMAWLRYGAGAVGVEMDGSGYLAAPEERRVVAACSWVGTKWPHLAGDAVTLRAVVTDPDRLGMDDDALSAAIAEDLSETMRVRGAPAEVRVHRWERALPVYAPGHVSRVAAIREALPAHIAVAGASFEGVGLSDCIRTGEAAGRRLVRVLADR
jgi:oxygen-dependent protoporphyrinogen oxidase